MAKNIFLGSLSGVLSYTVLYPLMFVHTRLAADVGTTIHNKEFHGFYDCLNKIYKIEGMAGFYRGLGVSLTGVFVFRGLYFGLHDFGLEFILKKGDG